jgi:hypothetical protein
VCVFLIHSKPTIRYETVGKYSVPTTGFFLVNSGDPAITPDLGVGIAFKQKLLPEGMIIKVVVENFEQGAFTVSNVGQVPIQFDYNDDAPNTQHVEIHSNQSANVTATTGALGWGRIEVRLSESSTLSLELIEYARAAP